MQNRMNKKDIQALRNGLNLLLTDCKRYMKHYEMAMTYIECKKCTLTTPYGEPYQIGCSYFLVELTRICKMLIGSGLTNRYQPKPKYPKTGKFKSGRSIVLSRQPAIPGDNDNER